MAMAFFNRVRYTADRGVVAASAFMPRRSCFSSLPSDDGTLFRDITAIQPAAASSPRVPPRLPPPFLPVPPSLATEARAHVTDDHTLQVCRVCEWCVSN